MAASGSKSSDSIDVKSPKQLDRMMHFNKEVTKKIFEPAMAKRLDNQWKDFKFSVRAYLFGSRLKWNGSLSTSTLTVSFQVRETYTRKKLPLKKPKKRALPKSAYSSKKEHRPRKKRKK